MKRQRGRSRNNNNNNRNNNHNNQNRALDSNGPEVKVRGTAATIYEKYTTLARDAKTSGNRVKAENLRQHAEHYLRIMNAQEEAKQAAQKERDAAQQERDAAQQERDAARAARGETGEGADTEERKSRRHQSRRNHRDKDEPPKSDKIKAEAPDSEKPQAEKPKSENLEPKESASEQALEVLTPEADNDATAEETLKIKDKPKSRRKAPARKADDDTSEAIDAAE